MSIIVIIYRIFLLIIVLIVYNPICYTTVNSDQI